MSPATTTHAINKNAHYQPNIQAQGPAESENIDPTFSQQQLTYPDPGYANFNNEVIHGPTTNFDTPQLDLLIAHLNSQNLNSQNLFDPSQYGNFMQNLQYNINAIPQASDVNRSASASVPNHYPDLTMPLTYDMNPASFRINGNGYSSSALPPLYMDSSLMSFNLNLAPPAYNSSMNSYSGNYRQYLNTQTHSINSIPRSFDNYYPMKSSGALSGNFGLNHRSVPSTNPTSGLLNPDFNVNNDILTFPLNIKPRHKRKQVTGRSVARNIKDQLLNVPRTEASRCSAKSNLVASTLGSVIICKWDNCGAIVDSTIESLEMHMDMHVPTASHGDYVGCHWVHNDVTGERCDAEEFLKSSLAKHVGTHLHKEGQPSPDVEQSLCCWKAYVSRGSGQKHLPSCRNAVLNIKTTKRMQKRCRL